MAVVEQKYLRSDGMEKVTGQARYTADMQLPGMAHAAFKYSDHAHARILSIDTSEAEALPGVYAVLTQADVPEVRHGAIKDRTMFAKDVARWEGEQIAAVAAETREIAEQAVKLIRVEYEVLPAVTDTEAALSPDSPILHPDLAEYGGMPTQRSGNSMGSPGIKKGDFDAVVGQADKVVEERYVADVTHPVPIEPHAVVAQWEGKKVTIWSTSQVPYTARAGVSEILEMQPHAVRVIVPTLGGGFGGKCDYHFEPHIAALARKAGRPVKLVFDRREEFVATDMTRHGIVTTVKSALGNDGTILGRRVDIVLDGGAYSGHSPIMGELASMMAAGAYKCDNLEVYTHTVYSNRTPAGSTRAPTGPQVCWAIESHTDACAEAIGMDPLEFRRKNVVHDGDEGPTRQIYEACGAAEALDRAAELIEYDRPREDGEGVGLALGWWFSLPMASSAYLRINVDGSATLVTGAQENGSGAVMGLALIVAGELGIDPEQVSIRYQDTDIGAFDMGSGGSQTTFNNARAVINAAGTLKKRLFELASDELEAAASDMEVGEGAVRVAGSPDKSVPIAKLAQKAFFTGELLDATGSGPTPGGPDFDPATCVNRMFMNAFAAPTFFCNAVRVKVDRDTGVVKVVDAVAVHDFGHVVNPLGAAGQVEGGLIHALGIAFTEGTQFKDGKQMNPNLLDYKLQTIADAPNVTVDFVEAPAAIGPLGAKGVGEPPVVAGAGAAANAVANATGKRLYQLPMTPYRVWSSLQGSNGNA